MRICSLVCLLALFACKKEDAKASTNAPPAATADDAVAIYVDAKPVGKIAAKEIGMWPRLDTLVPVSARRLGTWQTIDLRTKAGAAPPIQQPSSSHPDLVPALFPGDKGPAFGMFDPVELAKHGKPAVRQDGITEVRIALAQNSGRGQNEHGDGGGSDPTKLELTIKTAKGEQVIKGDALLAVPRQPMPGGDEAKGWPLAQILENAGVKAYKRVRLSGESGSSVTLEKQDLDPKTSVPFVKLNRQGQLRFRVFKKQGDGWQPGPDLRGLTKVEILE